MVQIIPEANTFGSEFAKQLGAGASQGVGNTPNFLMELLNARRQRELQAGQQAEELAKMSGADTSFEGILNARKMAAELARSGASPSELYDKLGRTEIAKKDELDRVNALAEPERLGSEIKGLFTGESKKDREAKREAVQRSLSKSKLTTRRKREILEKKGFGNEEIESMINPLTGDVTSLIEQFPQVKNRKGGKAKDLFFDVTPLSEPQRGFLRSIVKESVSKNPNVNLLELRKQFEKKGVDWREFRDVVTQLEEEGVLGKSPDYAQLRENLYKPPLDRLGKLLHGIKIRGR